MGESIVETSVLENKVGGSVVSGPTLGVSVSFGKFEHDSLSWEKWSSFSQNKYLEEVEKCSTPGSVAQKKAYFEAHYKKIADARKAEQEQLDLESPMESEISSSVYQICNDQSNNTSLTDAELSASNVLNSVEEAAVYTEILEQELSASNGPSSFEEAPGKVEILEQENPVETDSSRSIDPNCEGQIGSHFVSDAEVSISNVERSFEVEKNDQSNNLPSNTHADEPTESTSVASDCQSSLVEEAKEKSSAKSIKQELDKEEESDLVKQETFLHGSQDKSKQAVTVGIRTGKTLKNKLETPKLDVRKVSQKVSQTPKVQNSAGRRKMLDTPIYKSHQFSTPRSSKPTPTSAMKPACQSSMKKANSLSLQKNKNTYVGESKRVASTSLHMSLSLDLANSNPISLSTRRKSLIMEQMGDKDIVKRAFKTFQNNFNHLKSSTDEKSPGLKQVSLKGLEQKLSTSMAPPKENQRTRTSWEKMNPQRGQYGARWNSVSSRSLNEAVLDKRIGKPAFSSVGLRSDQRDERRKEVFTKLQEKSNAKEAEKVHLNSKSKEDKEVEIKKFRQSLNFKAKPMPSFYRAQGISTSSEKEGGKSKMHCRPDSHSFRQDYR